MSGSSGGGGGQQVTKSEPWEGQQPYLKEGFGDASALYKNQKDNGLPEYYPDSTVAGMTPQTWGGLDAITQRASRGGTLSPAAKNQALATINGAHLMDNPAFGYLGGTARGEFLNSNPYIDAMFNKAAGQVGAQIDSRFSAAGRYGSPGAHQDTLQHGMNDLATDIYGNNYARERQNMIGAANTLGGIYAGERGIQQQTMGMAPQLDASDYADYDRLLNVGQALEGYNQQQLDSDVDRWNYQQNLPGNTLANYMAMIQGNYGGSATSTAKAPQKNRAASAAGGALSGAAAGATIGSVFPGIGTAAGAVGGGLLGAAGGAFM